MSAALELHEWCAARGCTDSQLAQALGVERTTVSRIRRGYRRPSKDLSARVRQVTGVDFSAPEAEAERTPAMPDLPPGVVQGSLEAIRAAIVAAICALLSAPGGLSPQHRARIAAALDTGRRG